MKRLLLGGSGDGDMVDVEGNQRYVNYARTPDMPVEYAPGDMARMEYNVERYEGVKFSSGGSELVIYASEAMQKQAGSADELAELVLHKLVNGYKPGAEDEQRRPLGGTSDGEKRSLGLAELEDMAKRDWMDDMRKFMETSALEIKTRMRTPDEQKALTGRAIALQQESYKRPPGYYEVWDPAKVDAEVKRLMKMKGADLYKEMLAAAFGGEGMPGCDCEICRQARGGKSPRRPPEIEDRKSIPYDFQKHDRSKNFGKLRYRK